MAIICLLSVSSWVNVHHRPRTCLQPAALKGSGSYIFRPSCPAAVGQLQLEEPVLSKGRRTPLWAQHQPPLVLEQRRIESDLYFVSTEERTKERRSVLSCWCAVCLRAVICHTNAARKEEDEQKSSLGIFPLLWEEMTGPVLPAV